MSSESQEEIPSSLSPVLSETKRSTARYLFVVSVLSESSKGRITTGEIRDYLGVTPASVTEMISKLGDRGLVDYEKYRGVVLTDRGEVVAARAGWRFCVVSSFFESVLDTTLDDEMAFDIGFVLPESGIFRLQELVNSPCLGLCPESKDGVEKCAV